MSRANPETDPLPTPEGRAIRPVFFYLIVVMVFVADQASKAWIQRSLVLEESRQVIGNAFTLTLTHNTGGAWGIMPQDNSIFKIFAAVAIVALVIAYHRMRQVDLLVGAAFALALGGALGNLVDRMRYGYVVDFLYARIIHWPVFNIADSAISVGIILLLAHFVVSMRGDMAPAASPASPSLVGEDRGAQNSE